MNTLSNLVQLKYYFETLLILERDLTEELYNPTRTFLEQSKLWNDYCIYSIQVFGSIRQDRKNFEKLFMNHA